jgi:hypothetical protein
VNDDVKVPVGRIIRLVTKTVRFSKGGFTKAERRELGLDLLELAAHVLDDILEDPQEPLFDAVARPDAL